MDDPNFTLPIHSRWSSTSEYVDSLVSLMSNSFFRSIIGGVHILDFFLDDTDPYCAFLPLEWRGYFDKVPIEEFLDVVFERESEEGKERSEDVPQSLLDFLRNIREHQLLRGFDEDKVGGRMKRKKTVDLREIRKIKSGYVSGMSEKKIHEVEHFSEYLGSLVDASREGGGGANTSLAEPTHLVDFGSGLSYLSRVLACPPYDLDVVAIESDMKRIEAGKEIDRKAKLPWSAAEENSSTINGKRGSIQYFEKMISDGDLQSIVEGIKRIDVNQTNGQMEVNEGKDDDKSLMIISLHSCGNLTHHALNAFLSTPSATSVALVGCCYNLMSEKFPAEKVRVRDLAFKETGDPKGFPLSTLLTERKVEFNMAARMLASQAPNNWTPVTGYGFFRRHFYRALLQRLLVDKGVINLNAKESVIIGSLRRNAYVSFHSYVTGAVEKVTKPNSPLIVDEGVKQRMRDSGLGTASKEEMEAFAEKYEYGTKRISVMWTLMSFCASCVESMIVVDRWLYLKENPLVSSAKVETVFDYSLSPRNLAILATKLRSSTVPN